MSKLYIRQQQQHWTSTYTRTRRIPSISKTFYEKYKHFGILVGGIYSMECNYNSWRLLPKQMGNKIWKLFKYSRSQLLLLWQWKFMKFFFPTQLIFPYDFHYFLFLLPGIQPRKSLLIFQLDLWKYGKMISIIHWFNGVRCKKAQGYSPIAMNKFHMHGALIGYNCSWIYGVIWRMTGLFKFHQCPLNCGRHLENRTNMEIMVEICCVFSPCIYSILHFNFNQPF